MSRTTTMTVRLNGALSDFVASNVGEHGTYDNVSEYVRDLIRRDKQRREAEAFDQLKAELTHAFAAPESSYQPLSAAEIIARTRTDCMTQIRVQEAASYRLDEIYRYTRDQWGIAQADKYINGLFEAFSKVITNQIASLPVPAEFGVQGFFFRYKRHFVYWLRLSNGDIGIATVLHERMHQIDHFQDDLEV